MYERFVGISEEEDDFRIYDRKEKKFLNLEELLDYLNKYETDIDFLMKSLVIYKAELKKREVVGRLNEL